MSFQGDLVRLKELAIKGFEMRNKAMHFLKLVSRSFINHHVQMKSNLLPNKLTIGTPDRCANDRCLQYMYF